MIGDLNQNSGLPLGITAKLPAYFDHQATGTFGECERMAYYQLVLARKKRELSTALDWGKTFHACADIIKTSGDVVAVQDFIAKNMYEDTEDWYGRTPARMMEALITWVEWRQQNPIEVLRNEQPTIIKCHSPCPYYDSPEGCNLEYGGIMDEIVRWQGYVGPLDIKTTVMDGKDAASQYRLNHQMMGYDWVASHLIGSHCWGALVERIVTNKSKIIVGRFPISFSREQIMEWVENEHILQADFRFKFEKYPNQETAWRQNRARCWEPYACQYRDICLTPRSNNFRNRWILANTIEDRWDFMNRDKEK